VLFVLSVASLAQDATVVFYVPGIGSRGMPGPGSQGRIPLYVDNKPV